MKLALCLGGEFSQTNQDALMRIVEAMSKKHDFDYYWINDPSVANIVFFQDTTHGFPKGLTVPQIILSAGRTYQTPQDNQHIITWAHLEATIYLLANAILHDRTLEKRSEL